MLLKEGCSKIPRTQCLPVEYLFICWSLGGTSNLCWNGLLANRSLRILFRTRGLHTWLVEFFLSVVNPGEGCTCLLPETAQFQCLGFPHIPTISFTKSRNGQIPVNMCTYMYMPLTYLIKKSFDHCSCDVFPHAPSCFHTHSSRWLVQQPDPHYLAERRTPYTWTILHLLSES